MALVPLSRMTRLVKGLKRTRNCHDAKPPLTPFKVRNEIIMKFPKSSQAGFTLVEIMIVVGIIGLLAAIAVPNFVKARSLSQKSACIANLRQINGAKISWALENKKSSADTPTAADLYGPTLYIRDEPLCPGGGTYGINAVDSKPTCTIADHTL